MKYLAPTSHLFFAKAPDEVKEFNEDLSKKIIDSFGEISELLYAGDFDAYVAAANEKIAQLFPCKSKITIDDVVGIQNYTKYLQSLAECQTNRFYNFLHNENGVPVLNVIFPDLSNQDEAHCSPISIPSRTPLTPPYDQTSGIPWVNQLFARTVAGKTTGFADLSSSSIVMSLLTDYEFCKITPFNQNFFLSTDSSAGGKKHFHLNDAKLTYPNTPWPHYILSIKNLIDVTGSQAQIRYDNVMVFNNDERAFAPWYFIHETLHWLGAEHPHSDPKLKEFLKELAIKTGDPLPSMSIYSDQTITPEKNSFLDAFYIESMTRGDRRYVYLRPYDVLFLEAKRHERLICNTTEVTNSADLNITASQKAVSDYIKELENHSFETLPTSWQRVGAHALKRLCCVELPLILLETAAEKILESQRTDDSDRCCAIKFITSENGIGSVKTLLRAGINLMSMGVAPAVASFMLQGAIGVTTEIGKKIAAKTGLSETEIAKKFQATADYISEHVPKEVRDIMFGAALIYAANHVQYSQYTEGFKNNFDIHYTPIPRASITPAEAAITAITVGIISAVLTGALKNGIKKFAENGRGEQVATVDDGDIELQDLSRRVEQVATEDDYVVSPLHSERGAQVATVDDGDIELQDLTRRREQVATEDDYVVSPLHSEPRQGAQAVDGDEDESPANDPTKPHGNPVNNLATSSKQRGL